MTQGPSIISQCFRFSPMKQVSLLEHSPCKFDCACSDEKVIALNILDLHYASISVSNYERSDC